MAITTPLRLSLRQRHPQGFSTCIMHSPTTSHSHPSRPLPQAERVPSFRRCTLFQAMYPLLGDVPSFRRCTLFQAMYPLLGDVPSFRRCTLFQAMYPLLGDVPSFRRCTPHVSLQTVNGHRSCHCSSENVYTQLRMYNYICHINVQAGVCTLCLKHCKNSSEL